jgi:hypothetical protein
MRTALILHRSKYPVFLRQVPSNLVQPGGWRFVENEIDPAVVYDAVVVYSNVERPTRVRSRTRPILVTGEPAPVLQYPSSFIDQFGLVITTQEQIDHPQTVYHATCTPWFIGISAGTNNPWSSVDYTTLPDLLAAADQVKSHTLSMITSTKAMTKGHRARLRFALSMARALPGQLELFGYGLRPISDKGEALWKYRFHIAVENCVTKNYWTEKLADPLLAKTYPIYHGCPNLSDYFPEGAARSIDINRPREAVESVRQLISDGLSRTEREAMLAARDLLIGRYNFVNFIAGILANPQVLIAQQCGATVEIVPFREEWVRPVGFLERLSFKALAWRVPRMVGR